MHSGDLLCHSTPRLELLVDLTKKYKTVADIGCDHAYLSILLAREGVRVIASDVAQGPHDKALANIARFSAGDKIDLRLGDGLSTLSCGETEAIVIAGMGGLVIADILSDGRHLIAPQTHLYLQPMRADEDLRKYLYENGFEILRESLVREDRRIYTVMEVCLGKRRAYTMLDCIFSPALRQEQPSLFSDYFAWKKRILEGIVRDAARSENTALSQSFAEKLKVYEEFEKECLK